MVCSHLILPLLVNSVEGILADLQTLLSISQVETKRGVTSCVVGYCPHPDNRVWTQLSKCVISPRSQPMVNAMDSQDMFSLNVADLMMGCCNKDIEGIVVVWEGSRWVDGIYLLYSDSLYPHHDQPITSLATIKALLSQPTDRSKDPHQYRYHWIVLCHDSHNPHMLTNLCSMFSPFSLSRSRLIASSFHDYDVSAYCQPHFDSADYPLPIVIYF